MYALGETELERQTRLQADADAQRAIDTLNAAKIGSLPELKVEGNPLVFYILSSVALTILFSPFSRGERRRDLW